MKNCNAHWAMLGSGIAFDAINKIVLAYIIGKRTLPHAVSLLQEVKRITDTNA